MFIVVLIVFGLCWLPYHAYFFYTYYHAVSTNVLSWLFLRHSKRRNHLQTLYNTDQITQSFIASPPFQDSRRHASAQHIFLAFFWLAMANSAINPLIYFQMNAKWVFYIAIAFPVGEFIARFLCFC